MTAFATPASAQGASAGGSCGQQAGDYGMTDVNSAKVNSAGHTVPALFYTVNYSGVPAPTTIGVIVRYNGELESQIQVASATAQNSGGVLEGALRANISPDAQGFANSIDAGVRGRADGGYGDGSKRAWQPATRATSGARWSAEQPDPGRPAPGRVRVLHLHRQRSTTSGTSRTARLLGTRSSRTSAASSAGSPAASRPTRALVPVDRPSPITANSERARPYRTSPFFMRGGVTLDSSTARSARWYASRYRSDVSRTTDSASGGGGGSLFQPVASRWSRTGCLSSDGGLAPGR